LPLTAVRGRRHGVDRNQLFYAGARTLQPVRRARYRVAPRTVGSGLPLSFQLAARLGRDLGLLALAAAYERATPWKDLRAPL
jgi:hypothetical protein